LQQILPPGYYLTADKMYHPYRTPEFQPMIKGGPHAQLTAAELAFNDSLTDTRAMIEWWVRD
jgi:hypothetical protein